jgi:hypothetical protein
MPGNIFHGNWTTSAYLDQRATEAQVEALGTILSGQAGGVFAALHGLIGQQLPPGRSRSRLRRWTVSTGSRYLGY